MNDKLTEIGDRLRGIKGRVFYSNQDHDDILEAIGMLVEEVDRIDNRLSRTANIASCLANGIEPD